MGGAGSGGHSKAEARDIADHWEKLSQLGPSDLRTPQVRCIHCGKVRSKNTTRQRDHLAECRPYLEAMAENGERPVTATVPTPRKSFAAPRETSVLYPSSTRTQSTSIQANPRQGTPTQSPPLPKNASQGKKAGRSHSIAIRIQALALAEAGFDANRVWQICGVAPWTLSYIKKTARARGYDPAVSMQLKEEYVTEGKGHGRPKKEPEGAARIQPTPIYYQGHAQHATPQPQQPLAVTHHLALAALMAPLQPPTLSQPPIQAGQLSYDTARETFQPAINNEEPNVTTSTLSNDGSEASDVEVDAQLVEQLEEQLQQASSDSESDQDAAGVEKAADGEDAGVEAPIIESSPQVAAYASAATSTPQAKGRIASDLENASHQLEALLNPAKDGPSARSTLRPIDGRGEVPRVKRKYNKKPKPIVPSNQQFDNFMNTSESAPFAGRDVRLPPGNWNFDMTTPTT